MKFQVFEKASVDLMYQLSVCLISSLWKGLLQYRHKLVASVTNMTFISKTFLPFVGTSDNFRSFANVNVQVVFESEVLFNLFSSALSA